MSSAGLEAATYVDASVLVAALAPDDVHHGEALEFLAQQDGAKDIVVTSVIAEVELSRALRRRGASHEMIDFARELLDRCELVELTHEIRAAAIEVLPVATRSLDAIHVATAVVAGLAAFATFDVRQQVTAEEAGLACIVTATE
ncbi:MAG: type II toxin-antitoxin system VapC family toxin [Acidimicrobiales bacterium]